jgi:uncharacterized protein with GYD domain
MARYVFLVTWTDQGIMNAKDTVQRAEAFRSMTKAMGGDVSALLWTLGRYDLVALAEAPDDEPAASISMKATALGNARAERRRAFSDQEMGTILGKIG